MCSVHVLFPVMPLDFLWIFAITSWCWRTRFGAIRMNGALLLPYNPRMAAGIEVRITRPGAGVADATVAPPCPHSACVYAVGGLLFLFAARLAARWLRILSLFSTYHWWW
jgi:hypothetical protein